MRIGVTGAQGYLGSALTAELEKRGEVVVELVRRPTTDSTREQIAFDLAKGLAPDALREARLDALVHLAYDFRPTRWEAIEKANFDGSVALFDAFAAAGGTRGVYVSTIAAYSGCRSLYGKAKLLTEAVALDRGYWVVRPGLIMGNEPRGIVGRIFQLVRRFPVVPIIGYGVKSLYPVSITDLVGLFATLVHRTPPSRADALIVAARPVPLSLDEVVRQLATKHNIRVPFLVPIPWRLAWLGLKCLETVGISIGLRSDSVVSLMNADRNPQISDLSKLMSLTGTDSKNSGLQYDLGE